MTFGSLLRFWFPMDAVVFLRVGLRFLSTSKNVHSVFFLPFVNIRLSSFVIMLPLVQLLLPKMGGYLTDKDDIHQGRLEMFMHEVRYRVSTQLVSTPCQACLSYLLFDYADVLYVMTCAGVIDANFVFRYIIKMYFTNSGRLPRGIGE